MKNMNVKIVKKTDETELVSQKTQNKEHNKDNIITIIVPIDNSIVGVKVPIEKSNDVKQLLEEFRNGKYSADEFQQLLKNNLGLSDIAWRDFKQKIMGEKYQ